MQKRDLWYGYRSTMCDTWTLRGYYYRQVGYEAAYAPVLACKVNWGCVACPRALGGRQCSPRAMGSGAIRRQRRRDAWARSESMRPRARDWLVAIASNKALPLSASRHAHHGMA